MCTKQDKIISSLESKTSVLKNDLDKSKTKIDIHVSSSTSNKCSSLETKVVELKQIIFKYEKGKLGLESVLNSQRYSNDRSGLSYSNLINLVKSRRPSLSNLSMLIKLSKLEMLKIISIQERVMIKILTIPPRKNIYYNMPIRFYLIIKEIPIIHNT